jgi:hypothetical protein
MHAQTWEVRMHRFVASLATLLLTLVPLIAEAVPTFYTDRPSFVADSRVTTTTTIDFDSDAPGTDLTGVTRSGATFNAPASTPLQVIAGATGVRNPMSPSTLPNVLSPGGSNAALENDDLEIVFATPVQAAGMDVVFDVPDGASFVTVTFFDAGNASISQCIRNPIPAPSGAPGFQFVGCVTDSANIKRITFDEFDPTAPDDNVAYDTLTFSPAAATRAVPEPASISLLGGGFVALALARKLRRNL